MLINIFGIEVKKNRDEEIPNEIIYAERTVSDSTKDMLDKNFDNLNNWDKKVSLPLWLIIIKYIAMFLVICITCGILQADVSIKKAFENAGYLFFTDGISLIILIAIIIYDSRLKKKTDENEQLAEDLYDFNEIASLAYQELEIPENAESIDLICERYRIKNNKAKHVGFSSIIPHLNLDRFIYIQNDMVCIANLYSVIEFPINAIKSIELQKKKAIFPEWHKKISINDESLKKYKIAIGQGSIITKYYKVIVKTLNREFYLLIPNYDIELFCYITNTYIDEI